MLRRPPLATLLTGVLPALVCCLALGCGGNKTYRVSGKVTFKGAAVPSGKVYFIPDTSKGNTGPTGYANIVNGDYDTDSTGGSGAVAGPVVIAVEGLDPSAPPDKDKAEKGNKSEEATVKLLFARYETTAELPASSSTKDIDVPAEAGKGPTQPKKNPGEIVP
jgi:putative alpha-1,2-mannosidase